MDFCGDSYVCARCGRDSNMYGHSNSDGTWYCESAPFAIPLTDVQRQHIAEFDRRAAERRAAQAATR